MTNDSVTANDSRSLNPPCAKHLTELFVGETFGYVLLIIVAVTGNSLIGLIVFKTKSMRKTINYLIVNMAMSDLLLPIFAFSRKMANLYVGHWLIGGPFGMALCKLVYFFQDVSTVVSIQSLVLIAVDRFGAVVFPFRAPLISSRLCPYYILATWIIGMACHCVYFFARQLISIEGKIYCMLMWNDAFGENSSLSLYFVSMFIILVVVPFSVMTILYSVIIVKVKSQKMPGGAESVITKKQDKRRAKNERNVLNMALAILLGFALCWAPSNVLGFLTFFVWGTKNAPKSCALKIFRSFALFMAYANSAINPGICFFFSENYRRALKNIFTCCPENLNCSCCDVKRNHTWNVKDVSEKESVEIVTMTSLAKDSGLCIRPNEKPY